MARFRRERRFRRPKLGVGLRNMRERLEGLGATLQIVSQVGRNGGRGARAAPASARTAPLQDDSP